MDVFGTSIPNKPLTNFEILDYVKKIKIPHFRGVFMRNSLPKCPNENECGIVNFNTTDQPGAHWAAYYKKAKERIYFDSYGQVTLQEIQDYFKNQC